MRYSSTGRYHYYTKWIIVSCDEDLARYYRNLVNQYSRSIELQKPMHGSHITVIAGKYELFPYPRYELWKKYDGQEVMFEYDTYVHTDGIYYWLTVYCPEFEKVRLELGLNATTPMPWHLTIGNLKHEIKKSS